MADTDKPTTGTSARARGARSGTAGAGLPDTDEAVAAGRKVTTTLEEADEVGYLGTPVDPRPDSHYALDNEDTRRAMHAEGKDPDRPPSREQVGPPRSVGDELRELGTDEARKRAGKA